MIRGDYLSFEIGFGYEIYAWHMPGHWLIVLLLCVLTFLVYAASVHEVGYNN